MRATMQGQEHVKEDLTAPKSGLLLLLLLLMLML